MEQQRRQIQDNNVRQNDNRINQTQQRRQIQDQQNVWQQQNGRRIQDQRINSDGRREQLDRRQQESLRSQRVNQWDQRFGNWQYLRNDRDRRLERENRNNYLRYQQRYWEQLRRDRERLEHARFYNNYYNNYRYYRGGQYYYTSSYGAQMLRAAINNGYEAGYYAGQSDRLDGWGYDYRGAYGYQDASLGYDSYYVPLGDYNYYFREGFRRGYEDGYYGRYQYGYYSGGRYSILGNLIGTILDIVVD